MELTVLDTNLVPIKIIDTVDSLIWTDRYLGAGDFEIYTKVNADYILSLREDYYLSLKDSEHTMIIEAINLKTDIEDGNKFIVTGRSLESILSRRIVWNQTTLSGSLQSAIKQLLAENAINPDDADRKIANLVFSQSSDPIITALTVDEQFSGENLYSVIAYLCEANSIGFKVTLTSTGLFAFKLYSGVDRSFDQTAVPFVSFSPNLDNLLSSDYYHTKSPYKTVTLVMGEGEGENRLRTIVMRLTGAGTGLDRREKFTDASDVSQSVSGGTLSDEQYLSLLTQRGIASLRESRMFSDFQGVIDPNVTYIYGEDYFLGDIVQISDQYGLKGKTRMTELTFSEDPSGSSVYPTFEMVE